MLLFIILIRKSFLLDSAKQKIIKNIVTSAEKKVALCWKPGIYKRSSKEFGASFIYPFIKNFKNPQYIF